jgi:hypothetical protein
MEIRRRLASTPSRLPKKLKIASDAKDLWRPTKKSKDNFRILDFFLSNVSGPNQGLIKPYHVRANLIWWDGTFTPPPPHFRNINLRCIVFFLKFVAVFATLKCLYVWQVPMSCFVLAIIFQYRLPTQHLALNTVMLILLWTTAFLPNTVRTARSRRTHCRQCET